jgi:hypothetical protein
MNKKLNLKKNKIKVVFLFLLVGLILFIPFVVSTRYEEHKQNTALQFGFTSNNATQCNVTTANTPQGILLINQVSTKSRQTFNNTINQSVFSELGNYCFNIVCTDGINIQGGSLCRTITPNGGSFDISQAILFGFIFLLILGLLSFGIYGLSRASEVSWQIFYICLTYVMMFCLFFISWMFTKNYLYEIEILESIFWVLWLIMAICFWPFIIGISGYLLKLQAEALLVQEYQKQGFSNEDSRELAKNKRKR